MDPSSPFTPSGWLPDPTSRFEFRYFNGETWTADVSAGGQRFVDPYGVPPPVRDGRATAAMVLGIAGVITSWMPVIFVAGIVCSVLAIIFGVIVLRRHADPRGFAITGLVTGTAGLLLAVVGVITTRVVSDAVSDFVEEPPATVDLQQCVGGDDTVVVSGSIENLGTRPSDYRIVVDVGALASSREQFVIEVDDVRPGAPVPFRATTNRDALDVGSDVSCEVVDVTGPLPFGLDL